jgi:hypothetical protein
MKHPFISIVSILAPDLFPCILIYVLKTRLITISRHLSPVQITAGYINNGCTVREILHLSGWSDNKWCMMNRRNQIHKCRGKNIAFNKRTLFTSKLNLNLGKNLTKCYVWSTALYNLDTSENRSEIPGKLWQVVLGKDGVYQLDRLREKWSITYSQGGNERPTYIETK